MSEPSQGKDLLEGVYRTPLDLLRAVDGRWPLRFDLAAHPENEAPARLGFKGGWFYSEAENALTKPWTPWKSERGAEGPAENGWSWLNPPYGDIGKWTAKAAAEAKLGARVVMLLPSATGASWLKPCRELAHPVALPFFPLRGQLGFFEAEGTPYA
jgi:hypothetical protein